VRELDVELLLRQVFAQHRAHFQIVVDDEHTRAAFEHGHVR
jgi:hypothetical protein